MRRRATFKEDEMMAGTEETGGLAEEQELPKTRSNDWLFDQRGKNSDQRSSKATFLLLNCVEAEIARGDGNRCEV